MSSEDTKILAEIVNQFTNPDNALRNAAVAKFEDLRQNSPLLIYHLFKILQDFSSEKNTTFITAVLLRKLLEIPESELVNNNWRKISKENKREIKEISINMLLNEKDKKMKFQFCNIVSQIFINVSEMNEEFTDQNNIDELEDFSHVFEYITKFMLGEINEENLLNIECALKLLGQNFPDLGDEYELKKNSFVDSFRNFFKTNSNSLKSKTARCISEIISYEKFQVAKGFGEFLLPILETTLRCFENSKEEDNLKICLESISEIIHSHPKILSKHFSDMYILMTKIIEKKDYLDEKIRELGFELIVNYVERIPNILKKDHEKHVHLIEMIYKYAFEFEREITDEWRNPTEDDYSNEDLVGDEKLSTSFSFLERLTYSLKEETLQEVQKMVMKMLEHSGDFSYKYIALLTISELTNHVEDIAHIDNILPKLFELCSDENEKVRNAAIFCVKCFCDQYEKQFTKAYHSQFMKIFLERIQQEKTLRNQLEILSAMNSFVLECPKKDLNLYIKNILTIVLPEISKVEANLPVNLRREMIDLVSGVIEVAGENIKEYSNEILEKLYVAFMYFFNNKTNQPLYKNFIEGISMLFFHAKEAVLKILPEFLRVLNEIQNTISLSTDPTRQFLETAYENIIPLVKEKYPAMLPDIVNSIIKLVQNLPQMSISSMPTQEFKIEDVLSAMNESDAKKIVSTKNITTSETEEMESSIKLMKSMIITLGESFLPYLENCQKEILPLLNYKLNSNIRCEAVKCLPHIVECASKFSSKEVAGNLAKFYLSEIMNSIQNDSEPDNTAFYSKLKRIGKIVSLLDYFLSKEELNKLFENLSMLIDETEKRRLWLLKRKEEIANPEVKISRRTKEGEEEDDDEDQQEEIEGLEEDIEEIENIQSVLSDNIGFSFKTHKDISHDIVSYIISNWLPKYFRKEASNFEISMGIFIIDDMMQYLGQQFLGQYWNELVKTLILYTTNEDHIIRRAANYGIGEVAEFTVSDFNQIANDALNGLYKSLSIPEDKANTEDWGAAKDNATRSLGKIMKFHSNSIDLNNCFANWLNHLPIIYDDLESGEQHELLCDFVLNKPEFTYGENLVNLNKIVLIFAKVYASKSFTTTEVDEKIKKIADSWKQNSALMQNIDIIMKNADAKSLRKIKKMIQ